MKNDNYVTCASCEDKYICPHSSRGNWCGTRNGETRPNFGRQERSANIRPSHIAINQPDLFEGGREFHHD